MIGYFRRQNNLFMACGALTALLALAPFYRQWLPGQEFYMKAFYLALPAFMGVVGGRLCSSRWASRKLRRIDRLLYKRGEPEEFIRVFAPLVARAPVNTIEYVDGHVKLAYAYEAMGRFEESLRELDGVKPESVQLHGLAARALVANQRTRTWLLLEDREKAGAGVEELRLLQETASGRAPALASSLKECVRLAQTWLDFLQGEKGGESYICEEMELANNVVHRGEMKLLLGRMKLEHGDEAAARKLLEELKENEAGLYVGQEAARLLGKIGDNKIQTGYRG